MSELSKLVGAPRTDVLPGYTLARARLSDFGQAEEEIERRHIAKAGGAAVGLPDAIADKIIAAATEDVAQGRLKYGRKAFDAHALAPTSTPFLLYLTLRHSHPDMTRDMAASLITEKNETAISRAVLIQFGYDFSAEVEPKNAGEGKTPPAQTGTTSSPSSEPASNPPSVGQTSAT